MRFQKGKHLGKTAEEVVLKQPDYVQWSLNGELSDTAMSDEFRRLIGIFDQKPIKTSCFHCKKQATKASMYENNYDGLFFCDDCEPYGTGARRGTLTMVRTYKEALRHIDMTAEGRRTWKRNIIKWLAEGKGLPLRVGEKQALAFFA